MPPHVTRSKLAKRDLVELVDYLKCDSETVAYRFLDAVESTFDFLSHNLQVGQRCEFLRADMSEVRVWPIDGFRNHLVFYRPLTDGVEIVRVLHGARDLESLFGK